MRTAISGRLASNRSEPSAKLGLIFFRHTEWPNLNFVELTFKFLARSHLNSGGGVEIETWTPQKTKKNMPSGNLNVGYNFPENAKGLYIRQK